MSEKGWMIFHNEGAHAKEWNEIEGSAKILQKEHLEKLKQMEFKSIDRTVTKRELQGLNELSKAHGFDPHYLPPENLNTIAEYPDGDFPSKWHFYDYSPEIDREINEANRAKIKEHERSISAHIANDRKGQWCGGF